MADKGNKGRGLVLLPLQRIGREKHSWPKMNPQSCDPEWGDMGGARAKGIPGIDIGGLTDCGWGVRDSRVGG